MSYTPPVAQVQIAVGANGNPMVSTLAYRDLPMPQAAATFPPVGLPRSTFPDAAAAKYYATALLAAHGVISVEVAQAGLVWVTAGHTVVNGRRMAALRAPIPAAGWVPLAGTRN